MMNKLMTFLLYSIPFTLSSQCLEYTYFPVVETREVIFLDLTHDLRY